MTKDEMVTALEDAGWEDRDNGCPWCWKDPKYPSLYRIQDAYELQKYRESEKAKKAGWLR